MSVKRWRYGAAATMSTLGSATYGLAGVNWTNAEGNAIAAAIPQGQQTVNLTDVSWPSQGVGVTVTVNVAAGPQLVAGDLVTLAGAIHGNGEVAIVTSSTTAYTFVADTTSWGADGGPYAQGTLYYAGDDIQVLYTDKPVWAYTLLTPSVTNVTKANPCVVTLGDPHSFQPGMSCGFAGTNLTQLNAGNHIVASCDATHLTLAEDSTGYTGSAGASNGAAYRNLFSPTTCPASPIIYNSIVCTRLGDDLQRQLFSTNTGNVTVSGEKPLALVGAETKAYNLRWVDTAAVTSPTTSSTVMIGTASGTSNMTISPGCNALFVVQPAHGSLAAIVMLNAPVGSSVDIKTLGYWSTGTITGWVAWGTTAASGTPYHTLGGTLTYLDSCVGLANGSGSAVKHQTAGMGAAYASTAVINFNTPMLAPPSMGSNIVGGVGGAPTINVNAPNAFTLGTGTTGLGAATWNINDEAIITATGNTDAIQENQVMNAHAPLALGGFNVTTGKTLTVNTYGFPLIADVSGTVVVNGGVANAPLTRRRT